MSERLNLASRPFRNEALPNLLFVVGLLLTLALSVLHGMRLQNLLGGTSSALRTQVTGQEAELAALRRDAQAVRAPMPATERLAEWRTVKDLVDRRTFAWTLLLSRLESTLPSGIRLLAITPRLVSGQVQLELLALARTREDGFDFARSLQEQGSFKNVYPSAVDTSPKGEQFTFEMLYQPPEARP